MNRFRKITAQDTTTQSFWDKTMSEMGVSMYPTEFASELYKMYKDADPSKVNQVVNDAIQKIEKYDTIYMNTKRLYEEKMPDTFKGYLDGMKQKYNVNYFIATAFFNDAWNLYKTKFSSPEGFASLFHRLIQTYGANMPMALSQLKSLIEKLPSALGRVENEKDFLKLIVDLSENPNDPTLNKMYEQFTINEFIRDMLLGKSDEKLMASNVIDSKNLVKEIGRTEKTEQQKSMTDLYMAYNSYVDKSFDQVIANFNTLIELKKTLYKNLSTDIIENGLDTDKMKKIRDLIYKSIRTYEINTNLSPGDNPPTSPPKEGNK